MYGTYIYIEMIMPVSYIAKYSDLIKRTILKRRTLADQFFLLMLDSLIGNVTTVKERINYKFK